MRVAAKLLQHAYRYHPVGASCALAWPEWPRKARGSSEPNRREWAEVVIRKNPPGGACLGALPAHLRAEV